MSAELNIPDEAHERAVVAVESYYLDGALEGDLRDIAKDAIQAAAPLIVAAELERIASIEDGVIDGMVDRRDQRKRELDEAGIDPESDPTYASLYGVVHGRSAIVRKIRERVAELVSEAPEGSET